MVQEPADETDDGGDGTCYSPDEVAAAIRNLPRTDMARIVQAAKYFGGSGFEDLYQEAVARAIEGRRRCRRDTTIVAFICGVMKSLVSQEREAEKAGLRPISVGDVSTAVVVQDEPLELLISRERVKRMEELIADDEQLQFLVEGICDGLVGEDLQQLLGVDAKGLATLRRKLKRRLSSSHSGRTAS